MSARAVSMVGAATPVTRSGGPPAATMARLMRRIVSAEQALALGWALKTTALPAETMLMVLLMTVEVGFVTGVMAATTPKGAHSMTIMPASPLTAWTSRSSGPGALEATSRFLSDLVLVAPEAGLAVGHARQLLGVLEHGATHGLDDLLARCQPVVPEGAEGAPGGRHGIVHRGVDAVAQLGRAPPRPGPRRPAARGPARPSPTRRQRDRAPAR